MVDRRQILAVAGALAVPAAARGQGDPEAQTTYGRVRGLRADGVNVFKGIRYGADTRTTRFAPPKPPAPWSGVVAATSYGAASPQTGTREATSEDCLFLNVWTPGLRDGRKRPVLFYIHGGAYSSGSGSSPLYDGTRLVKRGDVVVVTVNHRLNLFGYLSLVRELPGYADSGNAGQLDLILALQWVRNNIREFGGDPNCVTVFGQSGGGAKIATMMAMPAAKGLFHRAWTMSGQQVTATGPMNAAARTGAFLKQLKVSAAEAVKLPTDRLLEGLRAADPILSFGGVYVGPVLDNRNLSRHPFWPDAPGQSSKLPMVLGNTHDETRAFLGGDEANHNLTWEQVPAKLIPNLRVDINPEVVVAEYRKLYPAMTPSEVFFAATTAGRSWRGQVEELEVRARARGPTWSYQCDFPQDGGRTRALHTIDIPLVFDNVNAAGSQHIGKPDAQGVADAMSNALLKFAKTGEAPWPRYTLPRRATMVFDKTSRVVNDPRGAERALFGTVPFIQAGT